MGRAGKRTLLAGGAVVAGLLIWQLLASRAARPSRASTREDRSTAKDRVASGQERTAGAPAATAAPPEAGPAAPTASSNAMTAHAIVHGDAPLRKKLLALPLLPKDQRLITAWRLGEELGKSRDHLDEVLRLLHEEPDPAVLFWLGETIRGGRGALAKLTDAEWVDLAPTLLYGQPAERRRAVAGIHSETMRTPPADVRAALRQCLRAEEDPGVLAIAARGLLVLHTGWKGIADDLAGAIRRMPAGTLRREMTYVYKRYADTAALYARFAEARSDGERNDWAHAISVAWGEGRLAEANEPGRRFVDVYTGVRDPDLRRRLLKSCPPDAALVRELAAKETDPRLRERLAALLKK